MSQYVVTVESSSLIHHRSYPRFVCFLRWFIDRLDVVMSVCILSSAIWSPDIQLSIMLHCLVLLCI